MKTKEEVAKELFEVFWGEDLNTTADTIWDAYVTKNRWLRLAEYTMRREEEVGREALTEAVIEATKQALLALLDKKEI